MTDVTYAEALQAEAAEQETVSYLDSNNNVLEYGDLVRVSTVLAEKTWRNDEYRAERPFDFGTVEAVNEDGTVEVAWYAAGCSCNGTRTESPADLTKSTDEDYAIYDLAHSQGYEKGENEAKRELRLALGLPEPSDDNDN